MKDSNVHDLTGAFRAMAEDDRGLQASAHVEMQLRAQVRAIARARRRRTAAVAAFAVAAGVAALVAVPGWRQRPPAAATPQAGAIPEAGEGGTSGEVMTAFLPLPYSAVPMTNGELVRLEVPRAALASFGLTPIESLDANAPGTVLADVLVGEDGLARAVRFVRLSLQATGQEQMP